mmetsp:Transcript_28564/g.42039  ORF Transcript_28564/g.42039 Transcript_28564/m.42039 type:complete len:671 (-) Transcript_28564:164-2176(-)
MAKETANHHPAKEEVLPLPPHDENLPSQPPARGLEREESDGLLRTHERISSTSLVRDTTADERFVSTGMMRRVSRRESSHRRFSLIIDLGPEESEEASDRVMMPRGPDRSESARSIRRERLSSRRPSTVYDDVRLAPSLSMASLPVDDGEDSDESTRKRARRRSSLVVQKPGCMRRHPILTVIVFALVGLGIGVGLSAWQPEDEDTKDIVLKWVGLVGDLFISALKALVLPLVFINVILAIADMASQGHDRHVTQNVFLLFATTSFMAAMSGAVSILSFRRLFHEVDDSSVTSTDAYIELGCNKNGTFLAQRANGTVLCSDEPSENATVFSIEDFSHPLVDTDESATNMSDTIYEGLFAKLVTSNVVGAFYDGNYAGVVIMALCFGIALSHILISQGVRQEESVVILFLRQVNDVILVLTRWVVLVTPWGVLSLIAQVIGSQDELLETLGDVGFVVVALILGCVLHFVAAYIILYAILTKSNPFTYLKHLIPSISTAFATGSSAVALPSNLECVKNSGMVPEYIRNLVLPLGLSMNMDGVGVYISCLTLWLAFVNNVEPSIGQIVLIIAFACIGSIGCPPVPFGALIIIYQTYQAVFGGIPKGYEYLLAVDWIMGRFGTVLNSTGDAVVAGMVSKLLPPAKQGQIVPEEYLTELSDTTFVQEMSDVSFRC